MNELLTDEFGWIREEIRLHENDWQDQCPSTWIGIATTLLTTVDKLREELKELEIEENQMFKIVGHNLALIKKNAKFKEENQELLNLLAIIHRDGGHHREEHGTKKSVAEARSIYYALQKEIASLKSEREWQPIETAPKGGGAEEEDIDNNKLISDHDLENLNVTGTCGANSPCKYYIKRYCVSDKLADDLEVYDLRPPRDFSCSFWEKKE